MKFHGSKGFCQISEFRHGKVLGDRGRETQIDVTMLPDCLLRVANNCATLHSLLAWSLWALCITAQKWVVPFLPWVQVHRQHPSLLEAHQGQRHQHCLEHQLHQLHPGIKTT